MIIIARGTKVYDGGLDDFRAQRLERRTLRVDFARPVERSVLLGLLGEDAALLAVHTPSPTRLLLEFDCRRTSPVQLLARVSGGREVADFSVAEEDLESLVKRVYLRTLPAT